MIKAMEICNTILEDNEKKCASFERTNARKVLLMERGPTTFIGDLSKTAGMLWHIKEYFPNAILDFNFYLCPKRQLIYHSLLKNSPYINKIFSEELEDFDFSEYDLIIYVDPDETSLLNTLRDGAPPVFSLTRMMIPPTVVKNILFPLYDDLIQFLWTTKDELYISNDEREWAENWIRDRGVDQDDSLFILFDDSSLKSKLLKVPVYFDFLQFLLRGKKTRVLNFDERGVGKKDFYEAWLGNQTDKMIFSKNLSLREALCILSARSVKMIFGPCTGLIHCASSIYNRYKRLGMDENDIPIMITYTGPYPEPQNARDWWGNSPLIDCLMLKQKDNAGCRLVKLSDLSWEDQARNDSLPCTSYTANHLINFVNAAFQKRSVSLW